MSVTKEGISFAIDVTLNKQGLNLGLSKCVIAQLVRGFLIELREKSGFIVKLVLGYVLKKLEEQMKEWGC